MPAPEVIDEARRVMTICNACRYCEGHCAVFPAMAMRLDFAAGDLSYLANLCHDCGACFHHCQYAPPHEFAVDVPRVFAKMRRQTWRDHAWPRCLAGAFDRHGLAAGLVTAASLALVVLLTCLLVDPGTLLARHTGPGAFYAVIPHQVMVTGFGAVSLFVVLALSLSVRGFWRDLGRSALGRPGRADLRRALGDALTLRYLDGGSGDGCPYPGEAPSQARRWCHHLTFYGFLLCFASTTLATVCHYALGAQAPYGWYHPVVVLGTLGGLGLLAGPAGLLWLRSQAGGGDSAFAVLLLLTSLSGLVLLVLRATPAMGLLLAVHLGIVLGLFLVLPYSRFVHALYRSAALLRYALERRRGRAFELP
jgi:citrate/tricarballylate utilization protein